MTFNEKIDKFMNDNNIPNLKQLAIESNIPYTTLRDYYERRSTDSSRLSTIRKLSEYMNCTMDYLAFDELEQFQIKKIRNNETNDNKQNTVNDVLALFKEKGFIDENGNVKEETKELIDMAVKLKKMSEKKTEN